LFRISYNEIARSFFIILVVAGGSGVAVLRRFCDNKLLLRAWSECFLEIYDDISIFLNVIPMLQIHENI
jgi:hypothetical protein